MLSQTVERALVEIIDGDESTLLEMISSGDLSQEPEMTSALATALRLKSEDIDGFEIRFRVVPSAGPGAEEKRIGADLQVFVKIETREEHLTKGFLVQAKRSGHGGLHVEDGMGHWLYDGSNRLPRSGVVRAQSVSEQTRSQCRKMLRRTTSAFVWVYDEKQVGVVSAAAVAATHGRRDAQRLGTKRLSDLFLHVTQCYLGDPDLEPSVAVPRRLELTVVEREARG